MTKYALREAIQEEDIWHQSLQQNQKGQTQTIHPIDTVPMQTMIQAPFVSGLTCHDGKWLYWQIHLGFRPEQALEAEVAVWSEWVQWGIQWILSTEVQPPPPPAKVMFGCAKFFKHMSFPRLLTAFQLWSQIWDHLPFLSQRIGHNSANFWS